MGKAAPKYGNSLPEFCMVPSPQLLHFSKATLLAERWGGGAGLVKVTDDDQPLSIPFPTL